ncbi:MAG TPA: hypothetical protein VGM69_10280 [Chloroflexota bacterium]|jgi:hypothetical protein
MAEQELQTWELWYPDAAATGLPFARGRLEPTDELWVHAAPPTLAVTVRDGDERVVARGEELPRRRRPGRRPRRRAATTGRALPDHAAEPPRPPDRA